MRKILAAIAIITVVAIIGLVIAVPMIVTPEFLKEKVEENASTALARQVTLAEAPSVSVFPTAQVQVDGLTVANADGFDAPYFLSVEQASLGVRLMPLLGRRVELVRFVLEQPDIQLEARSDGGVNWALGTPADTPAPEAGSGSVPVSDLNLGLVEVRDGTVRFRNDTGADFLAEGADLRLSLDSLDTPLTLNGTMTLQGEPTVADIVFTTPRQFIEDRQADLTLNMQVGDNSADTTLTLDHKLSFAGSLDIDFPALRSLIALAGAELETPNGFEALRLNGPVVGDSQTLAFGNGTQLGLDNISGTGNVRISIAEEVPSISGTVALADLDLRPYLPEAAPASDSAAFPAWSDEAMDLSAIAAVNADLTISAQSILLPTLQTGRSEMTMTLTNGRAVAQLNEMALYDGTGTGELVLNVNGRRPSMTADFDLSSIDVGAFAQDLTGLSRLAGTGTVTIDLATSGQSQADFVNRLNGTVSIHLDDGTISGVNLGKVARGAQSALSNLSEGGFNLAALTQAFGALSLEAQGEAEETDFSSLIIEGTVRNGILTTDQFSVTGPYFEIAGVATVDLGAQTQRIEFVPAVDDINTGDRTSLPFPVVVTGSFSAPRLGLDANRYAQQLVAGQLTNALGVPGLELEEGESVGDAVRDRAQSELFRLLSGDDDDADASGEAPADEDAAVEDLGDQLIQSGLNQLFGGGDEAPSETPDQ